MKAISNHLLAVTVTEDEVTGEIVPVFSFPVGVCSATDDTEVKFDIAAPSGAPRKQQYVDSVTGDLVEDIDCLRGVRVSATEFKAISAEQIKAINDATKLDTLVVLGVVPLADLEFDRTVKDYYLQSEPKTGSPKAYRLVYESLVEVKKGAKVVREAKALVTKRTDRSRQKLSVIYADAEKGCLKMVDVKFAAQVREPDAQILAPQQAAVTDEQIAKARQVIDGLADGSHALATAVDDALGKRQGLIEQALAGKAITVKGQQVAEPVEQPDDMLALLEQSLALAK